VTPGKGEKFVSSSAPPDRFSSHGRYIQRVLGGTLFGIKTGDVKTSALASVVSVMPLKPSWTT